MFADDIAAALAGIAQCPGRRPRAREAARYPMARPFCAYGAISAIHRYPNRDRRLEAAVCSTICRQDASHRCSCSRHKGSAPWSPRPATPVPASASPRPVVPTTNRLAVFRPPVQTCRAVTFPGVVKSIDHVGPVEQVPSGRSGHRERVRHAGFVILRRAAARKATAPATCAAAAVPATSKAPDAAGIAGDTPTLH